MAYTDSNQIGEITEVTGVAKIIRTDGTEEPITLGTEIYQGDVITTAEGGAVNIGFIDDSEFAVSNNAKITIDEFVFDPETEGGVQDFTVDSGVFMYTSGLIGRENPDQVEIDTPVGSIGIRGTIIGGHINPEGESQVSVLEGAIVVRTDVGEELLSNQYETVRLTSRDMAPSQVEQGDAARMSNDYGAVKDVSVNLFSSLNDQIAQDQSQQDSPVEAGLDAAEQTAADNEQDAAPQEEEAPAEEMQVEEVPTDESVETLEESIEEIKTLDKAPELKTIEIKMEQKKPLMQLREKAAKTSETRNEAKDNDNTDHTTADPIVSNVTTESTPSVPQTIEILQNNGLNESRNGATMSGNNILVGQVALTNASNVTYDILNTDVGTFTIDSDGYIYFSGQHHKDYEKGDIFTLNVSATDTDTGNSAQSVFEVGLNDVNEVALALEDVYKVGNMHNLNDDIGVIAEGEPGARIAKLVINGPDMETLTAANFGFSGTVGTMATENFFTVVEDNGEFYLTLQSGYMIVDLASSKYIHDGSAPIGNALPSVIDLNLQINDVDVQTLQFETAPLLPIVGNPVLSADYADYIIGDDNDSSITIVDETFSYFNAGGGEDLLILNTHSDSRGYYDFTNKELSGIEQITFRGNNTSDTLKIDMDTLIRLLKTSEYSYEGNAEFVISANVPPATGTSVNGVHFYQADGATQTNLESEGFVHIGTQDRGAVGEYQLYQHEQHGTIAIESQINGAESGGL